MRLGTVKDLIGFKTMSQAIDVEVILFFQVRDLALNSAQAFKKLRFSSSQLGARTHLLPIGVELEGVVDGFL